MALQEVEVDKAANVEEKVREYIVRNLMLKRAGTVLDPDLQLLETGIMTSFGIVELVTYLENTFGVVIEEHDIVPENFQTVRAITRLVETRRG